MADPDIEIPEPGILSEFISFLFPIRCVHCGAAGNWLCEPCARLMRAIGPHACRRCGRPFPRDTDGCRECSRRGLCFRSAGAAFLFGGPARSLVHRLKYSGQRRLAAFMASISAPALEKFLQKQEISSGLTSNSQDVNLSYVPVHSSKLVNRGYNQAEIYAKALARQLGLPLKGLLCKLHPTTSQNRLNFDERRKNIGNSVSLAPGAGAGGKVILVDDVYTTGATASECARALKQDLGVEVHIWTFARTVRRRSAGGMES